MGRGTKKVDELIERMGQREGATPTSAPRVRRVARLVRPAPAAKPSPPPPEKARAEHSAKARDPVTATHSGDRSIPAAHPAFGRMTDGNPVAESRQPERRRGRRRPDLDFDLLVRVGDVLGSTDGMRNEELSRRLGRDDAEVRAVLIALEERGVVFRTGKTRGTRWFLG